MVEVGTIRRSGSKPRMRPFAVVEVQIPPERSTCLADTVIGVQIDLLIFRLAWVATISVWKHEIEFGCEQVNHGFEVAD